MGWHSRTSWVLLCIYCIATIALLAVCGLQYQRLKQHNSCKMTYSRPSYRKLPVNYSASPYELLQYENGNKFSLEPHPVLFVPGSLGSYKQARSIGSVASKSKHLQLFALDFKDEPTALHAHFVLQQAVFVNEAIKAVHALYEAKNVEPSPVILVGHSYGGLAAMLSLVLNNHRTNSVELLVMLSTPAMRPAFHPDASFELAYRTMSSIWRRSLNGDTDCTMTPETNAASVDFVQCATDLQNVAMVSISGGDMDLLVRDGITRIAEPGWKQALSVSSHDLEHVQFGIDHKAILWCNQLVRTVVHGIHLWTRIPGGQRNISFWIEHLNSTAHTQPGTPTNVSPDASMPEKTIASMPYIGDKGKISFARYDRLISAMGVIGGAVYIAAVDHAQLAVMALTALGCWAVARVVLSQLLNLRLDATPRLSLLIPELTSIFHAWLLIPLLVQQILPPPLSRYLFAVSSKHSSRNFVLISAGVASLAILIGGGAYLSQQGSKGVATLVWVLPSVLAFGVAILLSSMIAIILITLRKSMSPVITLARGTFRMATPSRQARVWRKKLERSPWVGALVPFGLLVFAIVTYLQNHREGISLDLEAVLLAALSILYYTAYWTFLAQWFVLLLFPSRSTEKAGYQLLLTLMYSPVGFLAYPTSSLASRILYERYPTPGVFGHLGRDLLFYLVCLLAVIVHLYLARRTELSVPSVLQWHAVVQSWMSPSTATSTSLQDACLHEDGGDCAIYEMTNDKCLQLGPGVFLGPSFRVVWCNCSRNSALPMAEYCEWCRCARCGNKRSNAVADAFQAFSDVPPAAIVALCIAGLSMVIPWYVGEYTFRNMFALAAMATLLAIQHTLAHP